MMDPINEFPNGNGMDPLSWRQIRTNMERVAAISNRKIYKSLLTSSAIPAIINVY